MTVPVAEEVAAMAAASAANRGRPMKLCTSTVFAIAAVGGTLAFAPAAGAAPQCVNTTPTTTQCQTPGHSQITTSPPAMNNNNNWWPYGGFAFGFGR